MALFRRDNPVPANPENPPEGEKITGVQIDYDVLATKLASHPLFRRPESQANNPPPPAAEPEEEDITPEEAARFAKYSRKAAAEAVNPYAEVFNASMPEIARDSAVAKLSPGQKMLYERYKGEVDAIIAHTTQNNPALAGSKQLHERAIKLMFGDHLDEVEALSFQHMKEEDLPPAFARPTGGNNDSDSKVSLTPEERSHLSYFQSLKNGNKWITGKDSSDAENYKYYQSIKPGFLHEMIAEHKARKAEEKK